MLNAPREMVYGSKNFILQKKNLFYHSTQITSKDIIWYGAGKTSKKDLDLNSLSFYTFYDSTLCRYLIRITYPTKLRKGYLGCFVVYLKATPNNKNSHGITLLCSIIVSTKKIKLLRHYSVLCIQL